MDLDDFIHMPGWEKSEGLQMTPGAGKTVSQQAQVGGVRILANWLGATHLDRGVYDGEKIVVNAILGGDHAPRYRGKVDLASTLMIWRPGMEDLHEYIMPPSSIDLMIEISVELAELLSWNLDDRLVALDRPDRVRRLGRTCLDVLRYDLTSEANAARALGRLITALDEVLAGQVIGDVRPVMSRADAKSFGLLNEAMRLLDPEPCGDQDTPRIDEVARRLGVSRRRLFSSFRRWPGVGPSRYLHLLRLHRLRARLSEARDGETTITAEAHELGLSHMGRLSSDYRELFGELPRETLGRKPRRLN